MHLLDELGVDAISLWLSNEVRSVSTLETDDFWFRIFVCAMWLLSIENLFWPKPLALFCFTSSSDVKLMLESDALSLCLRRGTSRGVSGYGCLTSSSLLLPLQLIQRMSRWLRVELDGFCWIWIDDGWIRSWSGLFNILSLAKRSTWSSLRAIGVTLQLFG